MSRKKGFRMIVKHESERDVLDRSTLAANFTFSRCLVPTVFLGIAMIHAANLYVHLLSVTIVLSASICIKQHSFYESIGFSHLSDTGDTEGNAIFRTKLIGFVLY